MNDSLLYVEPIYLEASNSAIPEVKRVIVAYDDQIAYEPTLGGALEELFGSNGGADDEAAEEGQGGEAGQKKTKSDYIKGAQEAYDKAQEALKEGDWASYGKYMDELSKNLNKLS